MAGRPTQSESSLRSSLDWFVRRRCDLDHLSLRAWRVPGARTCMLGSSASVISDWAPSPRTKELWRRVPDMRAR
eukprot:4454980-Alexandrium_andersonii.AAC.1